MSKDIKSTDVKHIYDENYFLQNVTGHDEFKSFKGAYNNLISKFKLIVDVAHISSSDKLLDIGCGRGEIILYHAKNGGNGAGVDFSEDAILLAKMKSQELGLKCEFICSPFQNIEESTTYNKIISLDFIEHLSQAEGEEFFRKCYKILEPNSKIVVYTGPNTLRRKYGYPIIRLFLSFLGKKIPKMEADTVSEHYKLYHLNEQNVFTLKAMAQKAGFRNCKVIYSPEDNNFTARKKIIAKTLLRHLFFVGLILTAEK